jgi:hypothetical protein
MRTRRYAAAVAAAGLAVLTAGCGGSTGTSGTSGTAAASPLAGLTASQILTRAVADLKAASSVHLSGSVQESSQATTVDLTIGAHACRGTIGVPGQGSLQLLGIGSTVWEKPDSQFLKTAGLTSSQLSLLKGKYLKTTAAGSGLGSLCFLGQFATELIGGKGRVTEGKTTTILGQPALQLTDAQQSGSAYVTISASPEFLRFGSADGHMDFTDYDAPLTVTAPPAADTVNGAKYGF